MSDFDQLLDIADVCKILGVQADFVRKRMKPSWTGVKIPFVMVGERTRRFRKSDIEAYLAACAVSAEIATK